MVIPLEYIVQWPMPTAPIEIPPALAALAGDDSFEAVMNFPVSDNTINLYSLFQQTYHQHPMIGGRVYRDIPGGGAPQDFLSRLLRVTPADDIVPPIADADRLAVLARYGVGRIIYHPTGDPDGSAKAALDSLLGAPISSDSTLAIYSAPSASCILHPASCPLPPAPLFLFGDNWYPPESWGDGPGRWFHDRATIYVYSDAAQTGRLSFTAIPGRDMRRLSVWVNGAKVGQFGVGDWAELNTHEFTLTDGLSRVEFVDEDGSWPFVGDPRCQGGSAVAGPFPVAVPCDAANRDSRALSLAIQHLSFVEESGAGLARPEANFNKALELLSHSAPTAAKPGETIILRLVWRASRLVGEDLTAFVHLLDANGQLVWGNDAYPVRGSYATSRWAAGEVVAYNVPVELPAGAAGIYTLEIGWYRWPSLERIALEDGETRFVVGEIEVQR